MSRKLTTKEFIDKSNKIHNNLYDYSYVDYQNNHTKLKIICSIHGEFKQTAQSHVRGNGCYLCSKTHKLTKKEFIKRSNKIHNNYFNYKMVEYVNSETKVNIICPTHGVFSQLPNSHIRGIGCAFCSGKNKSTTEEFILKSNKKHNNLYDYSMVNYVNNHSYVDIKCLKHGVFKQTPQKHLIGRGCPTCGGSLRLTNEEFINRANIIHDNLYNYNKVEYINMDSKIKIICNKHGEFEQMPRNHLKGNGCQLCGYYSRGELIIKNILDENKIKYITQYAFDDLKYKKSLKFDFGIINDNNELLYLIEYNGIQHYEYIYFLHRTKENFELYKLKDKIKKDYCIKNNIKLVIIKYDDYEKINNILNVEFSAK